LLRGVGIAQLGQGNVAAASEQLLRIQCVAVFGLLRFLLEFARLLESCQLRFLRLVEEIVGFGHAAGVKCAFRRVGQLGRARIIRFKSRQLAASLGKMGGNWPALSMAEHPTGSSTHTKPSGGPSPLMSSRKRASPGTSFSGGPVLIGSSVTMCFCPSCAGRRCNAGGSPPDRSCV
jgi:hypothetical protein